MRRPHGGSKGCHHLQKAVDLLGGPYGTVVHGLVELTAVEDLDIWHTDVTLTDMNRGCLPLLIVQW